MGKMKDLLLQMQEEQELDDSTYIEDEEEDEEVDGWELFKQDELAYEKDE